METAADGVPVLDDGKGLTTAVAGVAAVGATGPSRDGCAAGAAATGAADVAEGADEESAVGYSAKIE